MLHRIQNESWRVDADTGFLTITASILKTGIMDYAYHELDNPPIKKDVIRLGVDDVALADSVPSLAGVQVVDGHMWQNTDTVNNSVGHVMGEARLENGFIIADLVITDSETIDRIKSRELVDVSSAYDSEINWTQNDDIDGLQQNIRYNHVALLPAGCGRAGNSVRILNATKNVTEEVKIMTVKYRLSNGKVINVAEGDVKEIENMEAANAEMIDPKKMQDAMTELKELKAQMAELKAKAAEKEGELTAMRDQIEAALAPEAVEAAAAEMNEDIENAEKVMNSNGLSLDKSKKLYGHDLKSHVVQAVRVANSKPLTDEQLKDASFVSGMFNAQLDIASKSVTGANIVQTSQQLQNNNFEGMKKRLWG